jgi:hypothetical protein
MTMHSQWKFLYLRKVACAAALAVRKKAKKGRVLGCGSDQSTKPRNDLFDFLPS